jgi:hypothetical protein
VYGTDGGAVVGVRTDDDDDNGNGDGDDNNNDRANDVDGDSGSGSVSVNVCTHSGGGVGRFEGLWRNDSPTVDGVFVGVDGTLFRGEYE